ncbi:cytochrome P450 [Sandaracinobacter neustonicus]|uniref:Cytochrome P450 n=1 Tax=Sandaracinobacter neustonicus TaxID=1715348 RepID=A0A501XP81_9SPHN|nr:cytochrome P450 [Sandaracinobacter neustonicus]TPE62468.1 cytochrome P450 [Sandaracinobacter neustonicus]
MSWFSRFQAAIDGVAGIGGGVIAAQGGLKSRIAAVLASPAGQRDAMAVLRFAKPRLHLKQDLIKSYDGNGTLLLTHAADFHAVIERQAEFEVVYGPRMRLLTGGRDFFLGMQDGTAYRRDTDAMRSIVKADDLKPVMAMARSEAAAALAGAEVDLPPMLSARIPALMVQQYFGVQMETDQLIADATVMFHFLFADLQADPKVMAAAMAAKDRVNAAIDASAPTAGPDTLLGRAVASGKAGTAAFDADGIRANIIGIVIGAIPTLSKASCLAVEELLRRPAELAKAQALAAAGDEAGVADYLWEALRFSPVNPILYRRAAQATHIGDTEVAAGTMVLPANLSAMFDEAAVPTPNRFIAGRPWNVYALWGEGLHLCWGDRINKAILPAMLTPLLAKPGLKQFAKPDGEGTPFPRHYRLGWG